MGVNDQQKFCKVTVHRTQHVPMTLQRKPWERNQRATTTITKSQSVRSTVAYNPKAPTEEELKRWTATGAAAIDGMEMPTRRRAHTTTATMGMQPLVLSSKDPLSRMTRRFEIEPTKKDECPIETDDTETLEMALRSDSFFRVDTDGNDPIRQTFDEESKMFVPGTPPIPTGLTVDMLPTADFTPEIPSQLVRALEQEMEIDQENVMTIASPRQSRIRISTPGKASNLSSLFGDSMNELPTPMLSSSVGTPLDDHCVTSQETQLFQQELYQNASVAAATSSFLPVSSYVDVRLSDKVMPPQYQEQFQSSEQEEKEEEEEEESEDEGEQFVDDDDAEGVSSFIEVDSEAGDDIDMDIDESAFDVCDNFDAILGEPLPNRGSRWRFSITQKTSFISRPKRGMSSPPRMVGVPPPPSLARHMSVPSATPPASYMPSIRPKPVVHAPAGEPLHHGQMLHLAFKSSTGHTVQVSTQQRRSKSSVFSKLIECFSVDSEPFADVSDALRIIGHTSDGEIRGGDRISLARGDGGVLRIQKMSKKLSFSAKIDMKAKFVVCGVPEGTVVTDTTKFYLQSVYDRTKTIGFLKDRRHPGHGCLVMYAYRTTDEQAEPIQFFKRASGPTFSQRHVAQQGHAAALSSPTSPTMGAFM